MNEDELEEILLRVDERTQHMSSSLTRVESRMDEQQDKIENNKARSKKNQTKINAGTYAGGTLLTAALAKLFGLLPS